MYFTHISTCIVYDVLLLYGFNAYRVTIVQLAAAITRSEQGFLVEGREIKPLHKLLIRSDNSPSCKWAHKVSAKSERGQLFVSIYADLIEHPQLTIDCMLPDPITISRILSHDLHLKLSLTISVANRYFRRS